MSQPTVYRGLFFARDPERVGLAVELEECVGAVRQAISAAHQLAVHEVVLVKVGGVPRTSSGKVDRLALKK